MVAALIWLGIAVLAVINGIFREAILRKILSEPIAHVVSTILLSGIVLLVSFLTIGWTGVDTIGQAWLVGFGWLLATLAFEFLAGRYLFKNPWSKILADYDATKGRVWLLVPFCVLFGPALAFRGLDPFWAIPYFISQAVAISLLLLSAIRPVWARWGIALIFAYAAIYNTWLGLNNPGAYQDFANFALIPWYQIFIRGPFHAQDSAWIVAIAIGQGLSALALMIGGRWRWWGAVGVCAFLLGIAPLGVGSAFPFSILVSLAVVVAAGLSSRRPVTESAA